MHNRCAISGAAVDLNPFPGLGTGWLFPRGISATSESEPQSMGGCQRQSARAIHLWQQRAGVGGCHASPGSYGEIGDHQCARMLGNASQMPVQILRHTTPNDFQFGCDLAVDASKYGAGVGSSDQSVLYLELAYDWFYEAGSSRHQAMRRHRTLASAVSRAIPLMHGPPAYLVPQQRQHGDASPMALRQMPLHVYDAGGGPARSAALDSTIVRAW